MLLANCANVRFPPKADISIGAAFDPFLPQGTYVSRRVEGLATILTTGGAEIAIRGLAIQGRFCSVPLHFAPTPRLAA